MTETRYSEDHEWIRPEGELVRVGITDHAQSQLGDIVFIELPEPGRRFQKGDAIAVVESVKAASDVYAPIDGEIVESNPDLADNPGQVNASAEDTGWLFVIRPADPAQLDGLLDGQAYQNLIG